jgi:hypothetical protein
MVLIVVARSVTSARRREISDVSSVCRFVSIFRLRSSGCTNWAVNSEL